MTRRPLFTIVVFNRRVGGATWPGTGDGFCTVTCGYTSTVGGGLLIGGCPVWAATGPGSARSATTLTAVNKTRRIDVNIGPPSDTEVPTTMPARAFRR